jgi:DNA invertase Pin-like site-specific DNA recombinase
MRTLIYCRVSNLKKESSSFATQEQNCVNYCKDKKMVVREIHKEFNSGYGKQRILQNIIRLCKNINLVIYDITRFSRNLRFGRSLLLACLKKNIVLILECPCSDTRSFFSDGICSCQHHR